MTTGDAAARTVSSSVDVEVDPETAFRAFTEELDLWWVRGPINHHAGGRAAGMRLESGLGGRLLEVYDDSRGDVLELARVVDWEPPKLVRWTSSIDDVETEVSFEPSPSGTVVRVVATIPAGGIDNGGTAWVRVVPPWFGKWAGEREHATHVVRDISRLGLTVSYRRPYAAARWLRDVFGFEPVMPLPEGDDPPGHGGHEHPWVELRIGNGSLVIEPLRSESVPEDAGPSLVPPHTPWVYVDDVDAHYRRVQELGATIATPLSSPGGCPSTSRWTRRGTAGPSRRPDRRSNPTGPEPPGGARVSR